MSESPLEATFAQQLSLAGVVAPLREFRFSPPRRWRLDFAWPTRMMAIEVQGGIWSRGRHVRGRGVEGDYEKHNAATMDGWRVYYITGAMIEDGRALGLAQAVLGSHSVTLTGGLPHG